jgi:hypothetical protein
MRAKVAYLAGLAEGLDLDTGSPEGRVLTSMIDVLADMAEEMQNVVEAQDELAEYVEDVDYDLGTLEETIYADDDDDGEVVRFVPEHEMVRLEDGMELTVCPECGDTLAAAAGDDLGDDLDVVCPTCGCMISSEYGEDDVELHT